MAPNSTTVVEFLPGDATYGKSVLSNVGVGRNDAIGVTEVEAVGEVGARAWSRRPVVAKVAGAAKQAAGILTDEASSN